MFSNSSETSSASATVMIERCRPKRSEASVVVKYAMCTEPSRRKSFTCGALIESRGESLRATKMPARRALAASLRMEPISTSSCINNILTAEGPWSSLIAAFTSRSDTLMLAPRQQTVTFLPVCCPIICTATPVACSSAPTSIDRQPSRVTLCKKSLMVVARPSLPTQPIKCVVTPSRAHATAWLRPLPPGSAENSPRNELLLDSRTSLVEVSRCVAFRSMLSEPKTSAGTEPVVRLFRFRIARAMQPRAALCI